MSKKSVIRKFGLALIIIDIAKLLIVDISGLETISRVIAYITAGVGLILVSWIYQKFKKSINEIEDNREEDEK